MAHQVANQRAVVGDAFGSFTVTDPGRLYDRAVVSHAIDQTHEPVVQDRKLFPAQFSHEVGMIGHE